MISVENRVPNPGQEGRVLITPESGSPFYATLAMADGATQAGTPWDRNTGNLLQADIRNYPIASGQTVTAGQVVDVVQSPGPATVSVGQEVNLLRNGELVPHIIVHIGNPSSSLYDDSCNGVWVLRKDVTELGAWNSSGTNTLVNSTIVSAMQTSVSEYDQSIQSVMKRVKVPYCAGNTSSAVNSGASGFPCTIFPLSGYELGWTTSSNPYFPADGVVLDYFAGTSSTDQKRIANFNGEPTGYCTRSPVTNSSNLVWRVQVDGSYSLTSVTVSTVGYREAFILPTGTVFNENGTVSTISELTISGTPSQAIALQGGSAGDTIPVIFSGVAQLSGVTQGQKITSGGVQGFGAMDGWLSVFPYWLPGVKIATGSYIGTGTTGSGSPVTLVAPFSKILAVFVSPDSSYTYNGNMLAANGQSRASTSDYSREGVTFNWSIPGSVSYWNNSDATAGMNQSEQKYFYILVGQ